jgi:hypothetical protein
LNTFLEAKRLGASYPANGDEQKRLMQEISRCDAKLAELKGSAGR